jgi:glycosyltransferase involved in cell wall biosynthesis
MTKKQKKHVPVEVSVVFPAYNEAKGLARAVEKVTQALKEFTGSFEVIIAEDGSTDGTDRVAATLAEQYPFVKHLHGEKRLGRGTALKNAFKASSGRSLVYMDVDLATNIDQLEPLINAVESEGFDFATGSRLLSASKVKRSRTRQLTSKLYNFLVRAMLGSKLRDHQCGFKAFKREALMPLLDEVTARHWFWDTEVLVRAERKGYVIKEIPVVWQGQRETKVRFFHDSFSMGWQVVKLWWRLKRQ